MPKKSTKAGGSAAPESSSDGQPRILAELWEAAVALRGSIEPADYKRYVLPIIFLRFLSLRFEQRREELEVAIAEESSEYHTTDPKIADQILEDADEYRRVGAFIVPDVARWQTIRAKAQSDDIRVILDDALEALEVAYPDKLRGLLPRIYAGSNLDRESVTSLINLFSRDIFRQSHGGLDLLGHVYEYFIGEFASSEGKRGGEYFTPLSIVRTLVAMLEPREGTVLDPCCGSGGMFVQADEFTNHNNKLSFYGLESKDFTYRLARMNLFIHGLDGDVRLGNSYWDDKHASARADFVLANPPFNDGSKGKEGWGANRIPDNDPRLVLGTERLPLAPRNANTMWMLHFLHKLNDGGTAGFVMATGELSNGETARLAVRRALVEQGYVDAIVQLSGQLFANTQIPCSLWFLSKNRKGTHGFRERQNEVLFVDGRRFGTLIPGSRKQKQLSVMEIEEIASIYRTFKHAGIPEAVPGFCSVARLDEIRERRYTLTPGRYVGSEDLEEEDESFEDKLPRLLARLDAEFQRSRDLETDIRGRLTGVSGG